MQGDTLRYDYYEKTPEDFKIVTLGEIDDPEASYSFDLFWTFQHVASGRVFYGQDSGCSCPSPFENEHFDGPDKTSFTEVTKTNLEDYVRALWAHYDGHPSLQDEKREVERKVRALFA